MLEQSNFTNWVHHKINYFDTRAETDRSDREWGHRSGEKFIQLQIRGDETDIKNVPYTQLMKAQDLVDSSASSK